MCVLSSSVTSDSLQMYHEIYLLTVYLKISEFVIKFFFIPFIDFLFHICPALFLENSMAVWTFFFLNFLQGAVIVDYNFPWSDHLLDTLISHLCCH